MTNDEWISAHEMYLMPQDDPDGDQNDEVDYETANKFIEEATGYVYNINEKMESGNFNTGEIIGLLKDTIKYLQDAEMLVGE